MDLPKSRAAAADATDAAQQIMQGHFEYLGQAYTLGQPGTVNWNFPFNSAADVPVDREPAIYSAGVYRSR